MSGWGCPNELKGTCLRVEGRQCDPGMKGCILFGRFVFSNEEKNISRHTRAKSEQSGAATVQTNTSKPPAKPGS